MRGRRSDRMMQRALRIGGVRRDLDEELTFHFAETVEELMAEGMSREQAETEARRRFGDEGRYRSQIERLDREAENMRRRRSWLDAAVHTLQSALRSVTRSPALSVSIVILFALGIGANATMFATIDRLLLRAPDHIRDPDSVRRMYVDQFVPTTGEWRSVRLSYADYMDLRSSPGFAAVAGYVAAREIIGEGLDAHYVDGWQVTGNFWDVLGVEPHLGRFFGEDDDGRDVEPVAVLGYETWQRDFGGDPSVIGRTVRLSTMLYTVLGVAPPGFTGVELGSADIWLPFHHRYHHVLVPFAGEAILGRSWRMVNPVVRLPAGVPPERIAAQAQSIYRAGRRELSERGNEDQRQQIVLAQVRGPSPLRGRGAGSADPVRDGAVATWLAGLSLLVLMIACANVANLLLARSVRQRREIAIRLALGVSRGRLIAQTITEALLLGTLGAVAALALTHWGGWLMQRVLLPDVAWRAPVTVRVLLFVVAAAISAALLSALLPGLQAVRDSVGDPLRASSGGIPHSSSRLRAGLAVAQAAFAVVLLAGAGLFVRSLDRARSIELGFDPGQVLALEPWLVTTGGLEPLNEETRLFGERARERLARMPGVAAAAWATSVPLRGGSTPRLRATGHDSVTTPEGARPYRFGVEPDFFRTLGIEVLDGRTFAPTDRAGGETVAIVSRSMARHLWPEEQALGKCLFVGSDAACRRIVGIASDSKVNTIQEATAFSYYLPLEQQASPPLALLVRTRRDPGRIIPAIRRELMGLDNRLRFVVAQPLRDDYDAHLRSWRLGATLFTVFGLLAVVIAMIGLYSILAFDVEQRTREIGLRTALGASRRAVLRIFLGRAAKMTLLGTVVGTLIAFALAPRLQHLLFQTSARDPITFTAIAFTLFVVGLCAGGVPAWRAAGVDPNVTLRAE